MSLLVAGDGWVLLKWAGAEEDGNMMGMKRPHTQSPPPIISSNSAYLS